MKKAFLILVALLVFLPALAELVSTKTTNAFKSRADLDATESVGGIHCGDSIVVAIPGAKSYVDVSDQYKLNTCNVGLGDALLIDFVIGDCAPDKVIVIGTGEGYKISQFDIQFFALDAPHVHAELNKLLGKPSRQDDGLYVWTTKKFNIEYLKPENINRRGVVSFIYKHK